MRFIVDVELPPALAAWLIAQGHEAFHVFEPVLTWADDAVIWQRAGATSSIIVTKDEDIGGARAVAPGTSRGLESLEKLWDVWARLKAVEPGKDKRASAGALIYEASSEHTFRDRLDREARELSEIRKSFMIRHTETAESEHIDHLFHRFVLPDPPADRDERQETIARWAPTIRPTSTKRELTSRSLLQARLSANASIVARLPGSARSTPCPTHSIGPWTLLKASCRTCRDITHRFERDAVHGLFPAVRAVFRTQTRRKASGQGLCHC